MLISVNLYCLNGDLMEKNKKQDRTVKTIRTVKQRISKSGKSAKSTMSRKLRRAPVEVMTMPIKKILAKIRITKGHLDRLEELLGKMVKNEQNIFSSVKSEAGQK